MDYKNYFSSKNDYIQWSFFDKFNLQENDWWYQVQIQPSNDNVECTRCKNDTQNLKTRIDDIKCEHKNVSDHNIKLNCCPACGWWEWFDFKRCVICKNYNLSLQYITTEKGKKAMKITRL